MFKNKKITKTVSLLLILALTIMSYSNLSFASDKVEIKDIESVFTEEFINVTDETIVCYMEGRPIKKMDIDENGCLKKEVVKEIESYNSILPAATPTSNYTTIPSGYNNAVVCTSLSAPRYGQTNKIYYFTRDKGAQFASNIEYSQTAQILAMAAGFIPYIGPAVTISFTVSALYKSSVAKNIRSRTDYGKKVRINQCTSSFGTFYGVFDWSGRTIETHKNYTDGTKEVVKNLQFK